MSDQTTMLPEQQPQPHTSRTSRGTIAVIASVVVVVLIAAGGFAAWRFLSGGGPRPAEVLPASTFALVTVDLDPSGGQKVEAIRTLRKFPTFRDKSGLEPDSDPVKRLFDQLQKQGSCKDLDYERDVKPWIGQRAGVGGVMIDGKASPVAALQVSDADKARSGFARLAKCADLEGDHFGWTQSGDYIVMSDSTAHAESVVAAGKKSPLSEDADFQKWTDEAGGAGIVNAYAGRKALDALSEQLASGAGSSGGLTSRSGGGKQLAEALAHYKDFQGAAAVLHFVDGGIELSTAGGGGKATASKETVAEHVGAMPADTAVLLAFAVPQGAFDAIEKADPHGSGSQLLGSMLGIDFPQDIETLLGRSISISLGGHAPADLASIQQPSDVSVGALIRGNTDKIDEVIAKLEKSAGTTLDAMQVTKTSRDGKVALASNATYADQLLGKGSLADDAGFKDAVPHAEDAQMIAYVDLDGGWGRTILKMIRQDGGKDSAEVADNLAALRAFGASAWTDNGVSHGLLRLSLK